MSKARYLVLLTAALALAAALVAASLVGAGTGTDSAPVPESKPRAYAGIPQNGVALGAPDAPVTLVEYADLQCPYCAQWALKTMPTLVEDYIRPGKLRIVFRGLAFLGPDSEKALRTVLAAGRHDHLWDVVDGLYRRQGGENSGWVTDDLLDEVAAEAGLPAEVLRGEAAGAWFDAALARNVRTAQAAGVMGTPALQIGKTGGRLQLVELRSLDPEGIVSAIDALVP